MNKLTRIVASLVLAIMSVVAVPAVASAHEGHDDTTPHSSQSDGALDVPQVKTEDVPQSSGFVDDKGNPISEAEYNRQRQEATKGALEKYPAAFAAAGVVILAGVGYLVYKQTAGKKR